MRRTWVVVVPRGYVAILVAVVLASCGGGGARETGDSEQARSPAARAQPTGAAYPVGSGATTPDVPAKVTDVCERHKSRRDVRIPILCPSRVPAGVIDRGLGAGMLAYPVEPRFYLLAFHSNQDPKLRRPAEALHWFAGAGTRSALDEYVFSKRAYEQPRSVPRLTRRLTLQGIDVRVYRAPRYPRGGMFGDHTLAIARCPALALDVLGSAHGYQREDVSIALAVNLAQHPRCHANAKPTR